MVRMTYSRDVLCVLAAMYDISADGRGVDREELLALLHYRFGWNDAQTAAAMTRAEQEGALEAPAS